MCNMRRTVRRNLYMLHKVLLLLLGSLVNDLHS